MTDSQYDSLLAIANKLSMKEKRYRKLAFEIFKTLNILNPTYMQGLSYLRSSTARRPNKIVVVSTNTNTYETKRALDHWTSDLEFFTRTP